jgi:hypothetical protein
MPSVLELKSTPKEMRAVASGEKKVITREIRPSNARRHVLLNDSEECTGVIEYYALRLSSWQLPGVSILVSIKRTMLMEIEDENGNLVHYEQNGKSYQMVDIDYHLGAILDITGGIPDV